jgi:hypothetical protein
MLVSAIGYCRQAGLTVKAGNRGDGLVIHVPGVARTDSDGTLTLELRDGKQD